MAEGWKQIWEDLRNALRSGAPVAEPPPESELPPVPHEAAPLVVEAPMERTIPPAEAASPEAPPTPGEPILPPTVIEVAPDQMVSSAPITTAEQSSAEEVERARETEELSSDVPRAEIASTSGTEIGGDTAVLAEPATVPDADAAFPAGKTGAETVDVAPASPQVPFWRRHAWTALLILLGSAALVNSFFRFDGLRLWSEWSAPKPPAPDIIATFDGGQITTADLEAHFESLVPEEYRAELRSLETLQVVVQEMATDELARRWAAERKVDADETFQHTVEHITEDINLSSFSDQLQKDGIPVPESEIQTYYEANKAEFSDKPLNEVREEIRQRLASEKEGQYLQDYMDRLKSNASITRDFALLDVPEPTEAEVRAYYEANTQSYTATAQFTVDMLTVPIEPDESAARADADTALLKLRSGETFSAIPAQVSAARMITGTVVQAGWLGTEWDAAVKELQPGEVSDIIRAGNTFYIVRLIQAQPDRMLTFEEVRTEVLEAVRRQRIASWMKANSAKTLFILKGKHYTLGQFYKEYQELPPSAQAQFAGSQGMKNLADRLIERLLVVEDTYDQLLQVQNKELIDETRLSVLKQMMEQQEVDDKIEITEEELQQYYDQNQDRLTPPAQVRMRYIRIGLGQTEDEQKTARARADEAFTKLTPGLFQQGAEFAAVAQEFSEDPETAANGGELPFPIGETNDPFEPPDLHELHEVVLGLPVNQISPPFELGDSLYIVQPIKRTQPPTLSFDEAKPYIQEFLTSQEHDDMLRQLQERRMEQANLVTYDSALQAYYERTAPAEADNTTPTSNP